jgi:hypothetical protein
VETLAFALALLLINYCRVAKYYVAGLPKYRRSSFTKEFENGEIEKQSGELKTKWGTKNKVGN